MCACPPALPLNPFLPQQLGQGGWGWGWGGGVCMTNTVGWWGMYDIIFVQHVLNKYMCCFQILLKQYPSVQDLLKMYPIRKTTTTSTHKTC